MYVHVNIHTHLLPSIIDYTRYIPPCRAYGLSHCPGSPDAKVRTKAAFWYAPGRS